jgi:hypothetical protein
VFQGFRSPAGEQMVLEQMVLEQNVFVEQVLPGSVLRQLGDAELLFSGDYQFSPRQRNRSWDASADGERFLLVKRPPERAPRRIVVVTNWLEQLRRRMQTATGN